MNGILKILIIEDIVLTAMDLRRLLEKNGFIVTAIARTLQEARKSVTEIAPDLALIDIVLEDSDHDGIEIASELLQICQMPIIYLTANSELEQFRKARQTLPAAYLTKPFKIDDVLFNIELAYRNFQSSKPAALAGHIMLPTKGGLEMLNLNDIMYLKAGGVYAEVVTTDQNRHLVSTGLGQLEHYFNGPNFFRVSRSFIVNLHFIRRLKDNELLLNDNQTKISVPDTIRKELLKRLTVVRTKPVNGS